MLEAAIGWVETVKEIYSELLFEERLYKIHEYAGYICDALSLAVASANGRYFQHGQTNQLQELANMKTLPDRFIVQYKGIVLEPQPEVQKRLCYNLIKDTEGYLFQMKQPTRQPLPLDYTELAIWYQELCYTFKRVYYWCENSDPINAYIWCCMLQNEVDEWGSRFSIAEVDILGYFNDRNLQALSRRAKKVEELIRQKICENGVELDEYATIDSFLSVN